MSALSHVATLVGITPLTTAQLLVFVVLAAGLVAGFCVGRASRGDR